MFRLLVRGSVQGVGYRSFVASLARMHGIAGYVKNRADGSVEIVMQEKNDAFIDELLSPPYGAVTDLVFEEAPGGAFETFEVRG